MHHGLSCDELRKIDDFTLEHHDMNGSSTRLLLQNEKYDQLKMKELNDWAAYKHSSHIQASNPLIFSLPSAH